VPPVWIKIALIGFVTASVSAFAVWHSLPVVIFGDSVLASVTERQFGFPIINQSVGLLRTQQIAHIIRNFKQARSFRLTGGVILEGGVNDLILNGDDKGIVDYYSEMFFAIPDNVSITLIGIVQINEKATKRFGITQAQIAHVNSALAKLCTPRPRCKMVTPWDTAPPEFVSDGLHLTEAGMEAVGQAVRPN
jgi:lysophospholipase L1-like esterase